MSDLSAQWATILSTPKAPKVLLAAVAPMESGQQLKASLALQPGAILGATHRDLSLQRGCEVASSATGRTLLFGPTLLNWPLVERLLVPQDFRATIGQAELRFAPASGAAAALSGDYGDGAAACVMLWSPGVDLEDCIVLAAGTVDGNARVDESNGIATVTLVEGEPRTTASFPPNMINRSLSAFADAPDEVVDRWAMRVVFGSYPGRLVSPSHLTRRSAAVRADAARRTAPDGGP
jgi:hypothetical protein